MFNHVFTNKNVLMHHYTCIGFGELANPNHSFLFSTNVIGWCARPGQAPAVMDLPCRGPAAEWAMTLDVELGDERFKRGKAGAERAAWMRWRRAGALGPEPLGLVPGLPLTSCAPKTCSCYGRASVSHSLGLGHRLSS